MTPAWLTARPVAHRGLHGNGIIENSLSAARAAVDANYAIEVDLQLSKDGEVFVFHDSALDRLTAEDGKLGERTAANLKTIKLKGSSDTIATLADLLQLVAGKVPLVLELKSDWDGDDELADKVVAQIASYNGPVALMSFDPDVVIALRKRTRGIPCGLVAERYYKHTSWDFLSASRKRNLGLLLHFFRTRPHFVAYAQYDMPAIAPLIARYLFRKPLLSWTVRVERERERVSRWVDQIIFEHIRP